MPFRIAGIDVHKKMLAVAVADVEVDGDFRFEHQKVGTTPIDLRRLAECWSSTRSRKSSWVDRAVLVAGVGSAGTTLATPSLGATARRDLQVRSISPKRNRIGDPADARRPSPMRSGW